MRGLRRIRPEGWAALAGLLPAVTVLAAFGLNLFHGLQACMPFTEGCISVSRALRSGPGLWLFKAAALPAVVCMVMAWRCLPAGLSSPVVRTLGMAGAAFLMVYAAALGTEGELYRWMRRYGVVLYFGLTGLAQLLLARRLGRARPAVGQPARGSYYAVIAATWGIGVVSAFKRQLIDDPALQDRLQNALEWYFALFLSLAFLAMAPVIRQNAQNLKERPS